MIRQIKAIAPRVGIWAGRARKPIFFLYLVMGTQLSLSPCQLRFFQVYNIALAWHPLYAFSPWVYNCDWRFAQPLCFSIVCLFQNFLNLLWMLARLRLDLGCWFVFLLENVTVCLQAVCVLQYVFCKAEFFTLTATEDSGLWGRKLPRMKDFLQS